MINVDVMLRHIDDQGRESRGQEFTVKMPQVPGIGDQVRIHLTWYKVMCVQWNFTGGEPSASDPPEFSHIRINILKFLPGAPTGHAQAEENPFIRIPGHLRGTRP